MAKAEREKLIPYTLMADTDLMVLVAEGQPKRCKCLAQVACDTTSGTGVTQMSLVDHDVAPALDVP